MKFTRVLNSKSEARNNLEISCAEIGPACRQAGIGNRKWKLEIRKNTNFYSLISITIFYFPYVYFLFMSCFEFRYSIFGFKEF